MHNPIRSYREWRKECDSSRWTCFWWTVEDVWLTIRLWYLWKRLERRIRKDPEGCRRKLKPLLDFLEKDEKQCQSHSSREQSQPPCSG